jgi:hypothetical protein
VEPVLRIPALLRPEVIDRNDVHKDRLAVRLRSRENQGRLNEPADDRLLSIAWQKPPSSDSGKSCYHMAHREKSTDRSAPNDASAWSAPSREADTG